MYVRMTLYLALWLIPMARAPETGDINRLHFSGAGFWYVCHANMGPDSSDEAHRFRQRN